jgi:hypothetical protein
LAKRHYKDFVRSLNHNQRNSLRVLLSFQDGANHLRAELNVKHTISKEHHATGLARAGRTAELFPQQKPMVVDLKPESKSVDLGGVL